MPDPHLHIPDHSPRNYLQKLGTKLLDAVDRSFSNPETAKRNRLLLLLLTAFLLTLVLMPSQHLTTARYKVGEIAASDIRATQDYLLEDQVLTRQRREEVASSAPMVYIFSDNVAQSIVERVARVFAAISAAHVTKSGNGAANLKIQLEEILEVPLNETELQVFLKVRNEAALLEDLRRLISGVYQRRIVLNSKAFESDMQRGIEIRDSAGHVLGTVVNGDAFIEIGEARRLLQAATLSGAGPNGSVRHILNVISRMMKPNLLFSPDWTEARKAELVSAVKPVLYRLQKGEMIVRAGDRVSPEQAHKLEMIYQASRGEGTLYTASGIFGLVLVLFYFPYRFACKNIRKFNPSNRDILAIAIMILGSFFIFKLALLISANIGAVFPAVSVASYYYLFPFAAGAMVVRILLNSEVALVYCVMMAPLLGILFNSNMFVVIYALLGSVVGAHGVRQCQDRSRFTSPAPSWRW